MRTIKYRGQVEGLLCYATPENAWWYATPEDDTWNQFWSLVDRKTVGQFTGRRDKNGRDVYEGDLLQFDAGPAEVMYSDYSTCFAIKDPNSTEPQHFLSSYSDDMLEVIGNVYGQIVIDSLPLPQTCCQS